MNTTIPLPLASSREKDPSNGRVLVKKNRSAQGDFLSAIILYQMRQSDPKSEKLFGTPPGSVPPLPCRCHQGPTLLAARRYIARAHASFGHTRAYNFELPDSMIYLMFQR